MSIHPRDRRDTTLPFRQASIQGDDALKKYVARHHHNVGWKSDFIMREMIDAKDFMPAKLSKSRSQAFLMDASYWSGMQDTQQAPLAVVQVSPSPAPTYWQARLESIPAILRQVLGATSRR